MPVAYKVVLLDCGYRIDLIVNDRIVVEIKAVEQLQPTHRAQLLTYLKLGGYDVGLLINFNVPSLRQGIRRVRRNFKERSSDLSLDLPVEATYAQLAQRPRSWTS